MNSIKTNYMLDEKWFGRSPIHFGQYRCLGMVLAYLCCFNILSAQYVLPESMMARVHKDELLIRWEPESHLEWKASLNKGYTLSITNLDTGQKEWSTLVKPESAKEFAKKITATTDEELAYFLSVSRDVMYPDQAEVMDIKAMLESLYKPGPGTADSFRINLLSYFGIFSPVVATANGMGYAWRFSQTGNYEISIEIEGKYRRSISINTQEKPPAQNTQLKAKFSDHSVQLSWDIKGHLYKTFAYYLERSEDGLKYQPISRLPYLLPTPEPGMPPATLMSIGDSLETNYKTYYYRIRGMDFFGVKSAVYSNVSGYGFDLIKQSPRILYANQEKDNTAAIQWAMSEADTRLVAYYRLMRADSTDSPFYIAMDSIDREKRSLRYPMEYTQNHLRVEAVPIDGDPVSSIPVFVMGQDTVAPAMPTIVGATVDSTGRVVLTWRANTESDLWGYRIFRADFADQEYTLINARPTLDTVLVDTTHMDLGVPEVFYRIEACDKRNNRSPRTAPVVLQKPDVRPPWPPVITSLKQGQDTLYLHWLASPSTDVVKHRIFRRAIRENESWTMIAEIFDADSSAVYADLGAKYDVEYAYTIVATDETQLESDPAAMKVYLLRPPREAFEAILSFTGSYHKRKKEIKLEWNCAEAAEIDKYVLYRGWESGKLGRYKYLPGDSSTYTESITDKAQVFYQIKPIYKSRNGNFFSKTIQVNTATKKNGK